eukprot:TRINITY_DN7251_c0_g1_i1.p2 TRINITY_DN7251_c0_g1~~TRINITY_DN7251_c0_g1_i1.p2  ORF type:complete len:358 (-),score=68.05 TRINITY_DN7251_c0_g1_i1:857-1783(-)
MNAAPPPQERRVHRRALHIKGGLAVKGSIAMDSLSTPQGDLALHGNLTVGCKMSAAELRAHTLQTKTLKTYELSSKADVIRVEGPLHVTGSWSFKDQADLPVLSALQMGGVRQWKMVVHEDFDVQDEVEGWSFLQLSTCAGHSFLGGPCKESGNRLSKLFEKLPPHRQLRVTARYHFIDSWEGETAFLQVDDRVVWMDSHDARPGAEKGLNVCGGSAPEVRFNRPIDVTIPHMDDSVNLSFASTMDKHPCDASFGVDDIMLYVRQEALQTSSWSRKARILAPSRAISAALARIFSRHCLTVRSHEGAA